MQKIRDEKGITLTILVITIIVLAIISVPIAINTNNIFKVNKLTNYKDDLNILQETISQVYFQDDNISEIGPIYNGTLTAINKNPNDNNVYYVIDVDKLSEEIKSKTGIDMQKLNFGKSNYGLQTSTSNITEDVYIINDQSRTIYYVKGFENMDKGTIYSYPGNYTNIYLENYISE